MTKLKYTCAWRSHGMEQQSTMATFPQGINSKTNKQTNKYSTK